MKNQKLWPLAIGLVLTGCVETPNNGEMLDSREDTFEVAVWINSPDAALTAEEPRRFGNDGIPTSWIYKEGFCVGRAEPCLDWGFDPPSFTDPQGVTWYRYSTTTSVDAHHWRDAESGENTNYATYLKFKYTLPDGTEVTPVTFHPDISDCFDEHFPNGGAAVAVNCAAEPIPSWPTNPGSPLLYLRALN